MHKSALQGKKQIFLPMHVFRYIKKINAFVVLFSRKTYHKREGQNNVNTISEDVLPIKMIPHEGL